MEYDDSGTAPHLKIQRELFSKWCAVCWWQRGQEEGCTHAAACGGQRTTSGISPSTLRQSLPWCSLHVHQASWLGSFQGFSWMCLPSGNRYHRDYRDKLYCLWAWGIQMHTLGLMQQSLSYFIVPQLIFLKIVFLPGSGATSPWSQCSRDKGS